MQNVPLPLLGRCQCGALRYSVAAPPLMIYACHCSNCQKQTGSAFVLSATIAESSLSFVAGEPARTVWMSDAGNARYGLFCGACGTRIVNGQSPSNGFYSLRAGTLDDTSWVRPAGHIWMRSAQSWFRPDGEDLVYEGQPSDYTALLQRFATFQTFSS